MKERGSPRKVRLGGVRNPSLRTFSRRPQYVIPWYRPTQATVDREFTQRRRIGDPPTAGEHGVGEGSCLLCRSCREGAAGRRFSRDPGGLRHEPLAAGHAQGVWLPRNGRDPAHGALETEDRPPRRRQVGALAVGPSAAVSRRQASPGAAARSAADGPGGRRPAVDHAPRPADEEAHGGAQRHPQDPAQAQPGTGAVRPNCSRRRRSVAGWPRWNCPRWTDWR